MRKAGMPQVHNTNAISYQASWKGVGGNYYQRRRLACREGCDGYRTSRRAGQKEVWAGWGRLHGGVGTDL